MKAILICPGERPEVSDLAELVPLSNVPFLGKTLLEYWIEYLAFRGAREVLILATDRPEQVRALAGGGARWGVSITVFPERRELTTGEARARYRGGGEDWLPVPDDVTLMDHLPGLADFPLFSTYADLKAALESRMPRAATPDRIGLREIRPGVWTGLHSRISAGAQLRAPCWIGDDVFIGDRTVIGPNAILERGSFIESGAEVTQSVVGADTFVGQNTELHNSIALGSTLINWKLNSAVKVSDAFLMCSLGPMRSEFKPVGVLSRVTAILALLLTAPLALWPILQAALRGRRVFRPVVAIRPRMRGTPLTGDTMVYYELGKARGWLRRWPQLWNVARGQFAWVGNRPLAPKQARLLSNDFERLWFAVRPGLISLADTESGSDVLDDGARANASYYAAHANWRLDWKVFLRALFLFAFGVSVSRAREACSRFFHAGRERKAY